MVKFIILFVLSNKLEINKIDANIIEGLKIKYVGYVLAVLLIDTPPSIYGNVG